LKKKNIPLTESIEECMVAYERMRHEEKIVPAYDPEVFKRHPGGAIA
jgi:hypothetical protein